MIKKKKGTPRPSVYDKVKKLRPELAREDIVAMFTFDLDAEIPSFKRDGVAVADREELTLFYNGEAVEKIKLSDIEKLTLSELAELHFPPVSKSGVYHRLEKVMAFYEKMSKQ